MILAPSTSDAPDSSLSYMFDTMCRERGTPESRFFLTREGWDPGEVIAELGGLKEPVLLAGTAFAFVHLLDHLDAHDRSIALPAGSRVLETGGFKGRSREVTREVLHESLTRRLGVPSGQIVNQYGMCELGSQFYEATLVEHRPTRTKRVPPWVRTRAVDPAGMSDVPLGEVGILVHYDLANTGSVLAIQTSDLGRLTDEGFEVLGRAEGAEARGCSIAADALLDGAG